MAPPVTSCSDQTQESHPQAPSFPLIHTEPSRTPQRTRPIPTDAPNRAAHLLPYETCSGPYRHLLSTFAKSLLSDFPLAACPRPFTLDTAIQSELWNQKRSTSPPCLKSSQSFPLKFRTQAKFLPWWTQTSQGLALPISLTSSPPGLLLTCYAATTLPFAFIRCT